MATPKGVVVFDLDGTLLPNTTVSLHLGPWLSNDDIGEMERLYAEGRITNADIAEHEAILFKGRRREDAWRQLERLEFIDGLAETVTWIKTKRMAEVPAPWGRPSQRFRKTAGQT